MRNIIMVMCLALVGCSTESVDLQAQNGVNGTNGTSCSVSGTVFTCSDGTSFDLSNLKGDTGAQGEQGVAGPQGTSGIDGSSCTIEGTVLSCPDGSSFDFATLTGKDGTNGVDGVNGTDGTNGTDGKDGTSCTVAEALGGALIMCSDGTEVFISFGDDSPPADAADKTELCHLPPGNPVNQHTLFVGSEAVDAHLAHGDYLGECVALN